MREGGGRRLLFLVNHTEAAQTVSVPSGGVRLADGRRTGATIKVAPCGVEVLQR